MRLISLVFYFCILLNSYSQVQDNTVKTIDGTSYYEISNDSNNKLMVFLHGGVNNPVLDLELNAISMNYLLDNSAFLDLCKSQGYDIIIPVSNDSMHWLDHPDYCFTMLKKMAKNSSKEYNEVFISGFSDGGSGSYKIFYAHPDFFDGLIIFNGYPQHKNANKSVDYEVGKNKKILFFSMFKDKVIPYEFLLAEYSSQKEINPNTYFYLATGGHDFSDYSKADLKEVFDVLSGKSNNQQKEALHGFVKNDKLVEFYPYRKKIVRKYHFGKEVFEENRRQRKQ